MDGTKRFSVVYDGRRKSSTDFLYDRETFGNVEERFPDPELFGTVSISKVRVAKVLLSSFSLVFTGCGLALIGLGAYVFSDIQRSQLYQLILISLDNDYNSEPILRYLTLGLIGAGVLASLCGIWTFIATSKENLCMLIMAALLFVCLIVSQLCLGCIAITYQMRMGRGNLKSELIDLLQGRYNMPNGIYFTTALDYAQTEFACCGIMGDHDYQNSDWRRRALGGTNLTVPRSCCALSNRYEPGSYLNPEPQNLDRCNDPSNSGVSTSSRQNFRHEKGCWDPLLHWATLEFILLIAISIGVAVLEIIGVILTFYLYKKIRQK